MESLKRSKHCYRVVLEEDRRGTAREMRFDADGVATALAIAQTYVPDRSFELYEDETKLGTAKFSGAAGFWIMESTPSQEGMATRATAEILHLNGAQATSDRT